jgi:uncharacterized membrane protein
MSQWTDERLRELPLKQGVRQRGLSMTRLETFCDAAFAFATTLLVIAGDGIPHSYDQLITALKGTPAFATSFAIIAAFWVSHRQWSRRYGLEDNVSTLISLGLVFIMLVYVYPLKMVMEGFFAWISSFWLPTSFTLTSVQELRGLFIVYGVGGLAQTGLLALLFLRALKAGPALGLDALERLRTRQEITSFGLIAMTCLISVFWAWVMPPPIAVYAGFAYMTLAASMPTVAIVFEKKAERLARDAAA